MLQRKELKAKGKAAFQRNYWPSVIAALLITVCVGAASALEFKTTYHYELGTEISTTQLTILGIPVLENILIGAALGSVVVLAISIFLSSVIEVGGCSFFGKNVFENADFKEMIFGFDKRWYTNIVLVQFIRKLKVFLWSLLLIIPGIVKAYEYYMIPYILADNPTMDQNEAFALSKKMMDGHKMDVFIFELSFFGWNLLSVFTFGILNIFYVSPYTLASTAEIYHELKKDFYVVNENMNESSQSIHIDAI